MDRAFDVIVVGGGHAGCEAAAAAARLGARVALITQRFASVGAMSCNPSIGGLGKGHLVREIDALDGLMGRVADAAGIQFRMLNRRKGPAVRGPRAQADRKLYAAAMQQAISGLANLTVIEGEVDDLLGSDRATGVRLRDGRTFQTPAVVLTTGTFLRGLIHIGERQIPAGRMGEGPALGLSATLERVGFQLGRLKTGTPARLDGATIDWAGVEIQPGDDPPEPFSMLTTRIANRQVECGITRTTAATHVIIRANVHRSPMYSGQIQSRGPRYCPSIEDKIVRFGERDGHQIFLEPEGLDDTTVYPNGISTSLPRAVQEALVRSIPGLERAEIMRPGYAIEYDFVHPTQLAPTLECRAAPGLYLAGQINGTTGYEEAAALGLWAGVNAAAAVLEREPFLPDRSECYMAVLVDDLVTKGTLEPYRMFTSRAEYRLLLREDNADLRLTPAGHRLGLVSRERYEAVERRRAQTAAEIRRLESTRVAGTPLLQLLRRPEITYADVRRLDPAALADVDVARQVEVSAKYEGYIRRMLDDVARFKRLEERRIPDGVDYRAIPGLSTEIRERLAEVRPRSLGQASRIPGVTPAAVSILTVWCHRPRPAEAQR